jgi:hypothetical protein
MESALAKVREPTPRLRADRKTDYRMFLGLDVLRLFLCGWLLSGSSEEFLYVAECVCQEQVFLVV